MVAAHTHVNLLHDSVYFLTELDQGLDLVLPGQLVMVMDQPIDQLLSLSNEDVDAEKSGNHVFFRGHASITHWSWLDVKEGRLSHLVS